MKRSTALFFTAALMLTAFTGCQTTENGTNVKKETEEKELSQTKNSGSKYITVDLKSNPTTGGSWKIQIADESVAKLESDTYEQDEHEPGMVGVGGTETFGFKCLKPGKTDVKFTYGQMWEGGSIWETKNAVITVNENSLGIITFK